ncbi:hypothetical protein VKS41_005008 [Umbelopsis sp. WA50703]
MVIFKETTVPFENLENNVQEASVCRLPNSKSSVGANNSRSRPHVHAFSKLECVKIGSHNDHLLLQLADDGKTLKIQLFSLATRTSSNSVGHKSALKPLHLVFDSYIIPDIYLQQDEANQTVLCWVLTTSEDIHRILLPAPDQVSLFTPNTTNYSVQHLQSLHSRIPVMLKPVQANSVAIACQDGAIVLASIPAPSRIMGSTSDPHLRDIQENILNKSTAMKRSSSLFDNLKSLVGQNDANFHAPLSDAEACPLAVHSITQGTSDNWIIALSQDGKLQLMPCQPSHSQQPISVNWTKDLLVDGEDAADYLLKEKGSTFLRSYHLGHNRFHALALLSTKRKPIIYGFIVDFSTRQPVCEDGWGKTVGSYDDGEIVDFVCQNSTIDGSDQANLWVLWNSDSQAQIQHCSVKSNHYEDGRWQNVESRYCNQLPETGAIQMFVENAARESSLPYARSLFSHMKFSKIAGKRALETLESENVNGMVIDGGNDDLLSNVAGIITRNASSTEDIKQEWRKFIDLCIHMEIKLNLPITMQTLGSDDQTVAVLKHGAISIIRQSDDMEKLQSYANRRNDNPVVLRIDFGPSELKDQQMSTVAARTSVLKMMDVLAHLVGVIPEATMQRIDDAFLDILKSPTRDTVDAFAQEYFQTALQPAFNSIDNGDVHVNMFLLEWNKCPNVLDAANWLLEQLSASDNEMTMDQEDTYALPSEFLNILIISTCQQVTRARFEIARNLFIAAVMVYSYKDSECRMANGTSLLAYSFAATTSGALLQWTFEHSTMSTNSPAEHLPHLWGRVDRPLSFARLLAELHCQINIDAESSVSDLAIRGSNQLIQSLGLFKRNTQAITTLDMVKFANTLEVYGYTSTAMAFASMLNVGPGVYYVLGKCALKSQKVAEALEYFERAASGMIGEVSLDDESFLPQLLPNEVVQDGLWHYYHHIADMFASRQLVEQAAHFESLALTFVESEPAETKLLLQRSLFQYKLDLEKFDDAYALMTLSTDEPGKCQQANQLVLVLCQKNQDKMLCELAFDEFQPEVKNTLTKLAEVSSLAEMSRYWKLLYSYAVLHQDYLTGAFAMYMYAKRQSYSQVDETSLREQVRGYLTAKSTLSLVSDVNAYISVSDPPSFNKAHPPKILSVGSADIDKELAMAKARLAAFDAKKNIDVLAIQIPDTVATYIEEKQWDEAFYAAHLFSLDPTPILEAIVTHCTYNMKSQDKRQVSVSSLEQVADEFQSLFW